MDSTGRRDTSSAEGSDQSTGGWMVTPGGDAFAWAGRSVCGNVEQAIWFKTADDLTSEDAAAGGRFAMVSRAWRHALDLARAVVGRYLSLDERKVLTHCDHAPSNDPTEVPLAAITAASPTPRLRGNQLTQHAAGCDLTGGPAEQLRSQLEALTHPTFSSIVLA